MYDNNNMELGPGELVFIYYNRDGERFTMEAEVAEGSMKVETSYEDIRIAGYMDPVTSFPNSREAQLVLKLQVDDQGRYGVITKDPDEDEDEE